MREGNLPGLSVALVHEGRTVYARGFGARDLATRAPTTARSVYRVGSLTKLLTAVAILQLHESRRLDLNDLVARYLPQFTAGSPCAARSSITVRQLLSHSSGLPRGPYYTHGPDANWRLRELARLPQAYAPGVRYKYSNAAFDVAGQLVGVVSGAPFEEFVGRRIVAPLGMASTEFERAGARPALLTTGYQHRHYRSIVASDTRLTAAPEVVTAASAGGLLTTAEDYSRLLACLLGGGELGGVRLLSPASFGLLSSIQTPSARHPHGGYGLGVCVGRLFGAACLFHTGGHFGQSSYAVAIPALRVGGVAMTNRCTAPNELALVLHDALARLVERTSGTKVSTPAESRRPERLAGVYEADGGRIRFEARGGRLLLVRRGEATRLTPYGAGSFIQQGGPYRGYLLRFNRGADGAPECFVGPTAFVREGAGRPPRPDSPREWERYAGVYRCEGIGDAEIFARGGELIYCFSALEETGLEPLGRLKFRQKGGSFAGEPLEFVPGAGGELAGIEAGHMFFRRV